MTRKKPAPLNEYVVRHDGVGVIWRVKAESALDARGIARKVIPDSWLGDCDVEQAGPVSK